MTQTIILGMGTGRCGTFSLARILNAQPETSVSHEEPPLLPWNAPPGRTGIRERLERLRTARRARFIGDVASFYLPYIEEAVSLEPRLRAVCLRRPREEVVASFGTWLDRIHPLRINHWAQTPAPGWHHDPLWTRIFPQYDTQDREEGLRRYWDEYNQAAEDLARRFTENVRLFDMDGALNTEAGLRELLTFVGVPAERQVVAVGVRENRPESVPVSLAQRPRPSGHPLEPRRCVVLVPYTGHIIQQCEEALRELERRGYAVRRVPGYAAIDQGRNQMATDALLEGFEETMWIDSDVGFHPDSVERLRAHGLPIVCGIYPQKAKRALACHVMPGTPQIVFGRGGGLEEILYAGTGFLLVRREVYMAINTRLSLPMCNERFRRPMIPFFHPMLHPCDDGHWYLAEDYAFCQRARACGYTIMADTTIRLWHFGTYGYGWEDAGGSPSRHGTFTLHLGPKPAAYGRQDMPEPDSAARHENGQLIVGAGLTGP